MSRKIIAVAALLLCAACSTTQVRATTAPGTNLLAYRTFAFMTPPERPGGATAQLMQSPAGQQVRASIAEGLREKGYRPAAPGEAPDFLVAVHATTQEKFQVDDWGYVGPYWAGFGPDATVEEYTQGTIVVDFIDPRTRQAFWRGTATSIVQDPQNPNPERVAKAVDKLMTRVPMQTAAAPSPMQRM